MISKATTFLAALCIWIAGSSIGVGATEGASIRDAAWADRLAIRVPRHKFTALLDRVAFLIQSNDMISKEDRDLALSILHSKVEFYQAAPSNVVSSNDPTAQLIHDAIFESLRLSQGQDWKLSSFPALVIRSCPSWEGALVGYAWGGGIYLCANLEEESEFHEKKSTFLRRLTGMPANQTKNLTAEELQDEVLSKLEAFLKNPPELLSAGPP